MLFASCLENAHYAAAEGGYAALVHNFFDWNEVRVSTVRELAEVLSGLPDPMAAAGRVRRILQSVFEATYSFEFEDIRKLNLGPATEKLAAVDGASKFCVAYVVQAALGGHAVPLDSGTLGVLRLVEVATDEEVQSGVIGGLERAVPKNKGVECGSLLHQLGADFVANPYAPSLRETLLEINPDIAEQLPKRRAKKAAEAEPAAESPPAATVTPAPPAPVTPAAPPEPAPAEAKKKPASKKKKEAEDEATPPPAPAAKAAAQAASPPEQPAKAAAKEHAATGEKAVGRPASAASSPADEPAKKPAPPAKKASAKKKPTAAGPEAASHDPAAGSEGLPKRKPR